MVYGKTYYTKRSISVLDHGRIVETPQYGRVFYVMFIDWEDIHIHYSDLII